MSSEIELLKQQVENLKSQLKIAESKTPIEVTDFEQTIDNPLSNLILLGLSKISSDSGPLIKMYRRLWGFANYAIICGIGGTVINYIILATMVNILPLFIADILAILSAALWNYTLTVGSLGHLVGLAPKAKNKRGEWI